MERERKSTSSELELLKEWYRYNSIVRKKYLQAIFDEIPEQERYRDRGASFPSVVDIFMHVIDAYRSWFVYTYEDRWAEYERLRGKKRYLREEVESEEAKIDSLVLRFIDNLTENDLERTIAFKGQGDYRKIKMRNMLGI